MVPVMKLLQKNLLNICSLKLRKTGLKPNKNQKGSASYVLKAQETEPFFHESGKLQIRFLPESG